jgi:hypothetical protein
MPKLQVEGRIYNNTFKGVPNLSHYNACVGNNGQPDLPEYAGGFMDAALRLGELVIKKDIENSIDEFIYPIAFNMRHSVEVWLKYFLKQLKSIRSDKLLKPLQDGQTEIVISETDMTQTHNINVFWEWFKFNSEKRDMRFVDINQRLDEYISDIGEIDPTGQTFRYPYNTESQKHLIKTPIINLVNLTKRILELKELIKELNYLLLELNDEYNTETYTRNLSRKQLAYISTQLPHRTDWSLPVFDEVRDKLKLEFNIGSKEYTEALNIIQKHHEFAKNIGMTVHLKSVSKDDLKAFIDTWLVYHSKKPRKTDTFKAYLDFNQQKKEHEALKSAVCHIDLNSQADIGAIFYLARFPKYSEAYNQVFNTELSDVIYNQSHNTLQYLDHFLEKLNFVENMVVSLNLLGQTELLKKLQQEYEVVDAEIIKASS